MCGVSEVVAKRKFRKFFVEAAHIECGVQGGVGSLRGEICGFELVVAGDGDFAHVLFVEDEVSMLRGEGDFAGVWGGDTCQASFACAVVRYVEQAHLAVEGVECMFDFAVRVNDIGDRYVADGLVYVL